MRLVPTSAAAHSAKCELAADVLRSWGRVRLGVTGWSMFPSIRPGDTLLIELSHHHEVVGGDIVLFFREHRLFAHRAVGRNQDGSRILTRGDAMRREDPPVNEAELLGKVTLIWRGGKCTEPPKSPRALERLVADIVGRFELAARLVVVVYRLIQSQQMQAV
jgi:Peptidase S24-like